MKTLSDDPRKNVFSIKVWCVIYVFINYDLLLHKFLLIWSSNQTVNKQYRSEMKCNIHENV